MIRLLLPTALLLIALAPAQGQAPATAPTSDPLEQKIQDEISTGASSDDCKPNPNVPHGEFLQVQISDSKIYPGANNFSRVYVPAQYDPAKPACLLVRPDGMGDDVGTVLDNLIAKKDVPIIIGVGISPGVIWKDPPGTPKRRAARFDRSYEFDNMGDHFSDFVLNEVLPAVQKLKTKDGRAIRLSPDGNDHATTGMSTGGIGAFNLAWQRPDQFTRVYYVCGTFVAMRGAQEYPTLIRKTDPKPIRVFIEDGSADTGSLFGSWIDTNMTMVSALTFAGYDVGHAWGTHAHDGKAGAAVLPDVMRWLWRDYPTPVKPGISKNTTLMEITLPGEGWQKIPQTFQSAAGLAANAQGDVYLSDAPAATVYRLGEDDKAAAISEHGPGIVGQAFGPDGTLYGVVPDEKKIVALDAQGNVRTVTEGIAGHGIVVTHDGTIYVSEPGAHSDMPSQIWQIKSSGEKRAIDQGISSASGVAFSPDGSLFYAAEHSTRSIYTYIVQPDGSFADKQAFDWLHITDIPSDSGAEDLAVDTHGNLYVATRMGIEVCDLNGRVRAILPLPTPCGPVRSLCFGGAHFDVLYATDGIQIFKRTMKVPGFAPWSAPISTPSGTPY